MASRHEEKYIISYAQYALLRNRAMEVLRPDANGDKGSYVITSLYFDDPMNSALAEKLDGLPEHRKFRLRTYDHSDGIIKLERKDKHGILTEKTSAAITREQLPLLLCPEADLPTDGVGELAIQMRAAGLRPVVAVRYERDAFCYDAMNVRLTFDRHVEAIAPDMEALFSPKYSGIPVLDPNSVIMEIKYGSHVPAFLRQLTAVSCKQLSVSKYALCRESLIL